MERAKTEAEHVKAEVDAKTEAEHVKTEAERAKTEVEHVKAEAEYAKTFRAKTKKEIETMEFEKLQAIIADVMNIEDKETITMDTKFVDDLGADSLDVFQIIMGIEETFDIEIDNDEAEKISTVGDAAKQIHLASNE